MTLLQRLRIVVAAVLLGSGLYVGSCGIGMVAPFGPLLDPAKGIWAVARSAEIPANLETVIPSLDGSVDIVYDGRAVPHIFATTTDDAVRALGYVVARDRLFQLEVQTRATTGRLSEWGGSSALRMDRFQRSIGLALSAEREFAALDVGSRELRLLNAYAGGIQAWMAQMRPRDLPFEYHFLGKKPLQWEPVHSLYLMKRMGYTLAYSSHDRWRARVVELVGQDAADALFPIASPIQEPIQPNGHDRPRFDYAPLPPPGVPRMREVEDVVAGIRGEVCTPADPLSYSINDCEEVPGGETVLGSNNWAVAPARTASGHAILAGDPHLSLTLPSIWYEAHMVVPGEMDVYGVTIPGAPGIVIGFNRDVAWSFTNTGADVLDYFHEVVDDREKPTQYWLDEEWRPLESRVEEFFDQRGKLVAVDTIRYTHRGPLLRAGDGHMSMRWTVLDESGTLALFDAVHAKSATEWLEAMAGYSAPAQNGIVADRAGNIAIRSIGRYPVRADNGDGTEIRSGADSDNDWQGYWSLDAYPQSFNPEQGFLASANQQPVDPRVNGAYLGVNWPSPWRAMQINSLLRTDSQVTPDAMSRYHTDPGNAKADIFVPAFLSAVRGSTDAESHPELAEAALLLAEWDRKYTRENERAVLFEAAMGELSRRTWDELVVRRGSRPIATPGQAILAQLLEFPDNVWWDDQRTVNVVETRDFILAASLEAGLAIVKREFGEPDEGGWRWERIQTANIHHLLGFSALSAFDLPVRGGPGSLNPSSGGGTHGASWRMVVDLGSEIGAWTIYPGGQSGNPASTWYDNRIEAWVDGRLDEVLFPSSKEGLKPSDVIGSITLMPSGGGR
ncbi:MAG: penicillin acylase family protein [Gemmatimonadota bacterium]|nr:MAG: penicillin acylase family protein [Gemmatimonadota bacterium]